MSEDFIPDPSLNPDAAPDFIPDPALNANVDFIPDPSLNITPDETLAGRDEAEFVAVDDLSSEWVGPKTKAPLETIEGSSEYATLVSGKKPSGFWGNLFDVSSKDMPFTGDFESAAELGKIMWIGRKIEAKEDVKDEDLVKFNTFLAMRKQQSETGWLGKAGSTVREAATFGLEIAAVSALGLLSGGTGAVAGGAEMTGAKGAVKGLRKAAEKMTDKFLVARFGEKLGGAAAKIANASGRIASDTLVLDVFRAGAIKNEIAERKLADMLAGKEEDKNAAMMSIANWSVEHASEMSGEYLGAMVSGLFNKVGGKAISSALKNEMMKAQIFRAIASKFNVTRFDDVMGVMKNLGYHGVINEMYEERAGDFVRGLTGIDGKAGLTEAFKRAVPTWEQFKIESVAFAIPGIAHTAIGFTGATGVNPLELQKNFDLVSKAVANVQTRDEILKTSGDLAERIHQERANPWNRQFNFLGRLFNTANKGTAEDLLARANIKGVVEAYDAAPQGKGKEAVMDYLANKTVGIKIVDTEEQKEKALELLRDKKLVGYMYESGEGFNYYLRNKELLSDPATLKLAQETGMGFIKNVDEVDDTAIQNLEASHVVDAESVGRILSARNNADAEEIRGTLQAALKDPDIAGKIKYGLPMIIKGTRKQYEDANIGYTIAQDSKPMQDEHGDPIVDADGNNFYAMTSRGVTTNNGLILNKNSRLQDVKEEIHHLIARTALKNGQHSGEAARWAAQTRSTLESIVVTSQDEAKVSRAKALLGFSDFELIEKTHLYAVQDNKATDSTNMVFEAAGMKELGVLPDQRFDDYFTKLTNNKIHILRTKPRVAPAKPGVADTMVRDLVGSSVKGSVKMAKDIVGHVLETEVKDGLLVDLYLALKGKARRRNAKTPQPNIQRIDQILQDMSDRGFTYSLTESELRRKIAAYTKWMMRSRKQYKYLTLGDEDKFKTDLQVLAKLEKQLEKLLKEKDRIAMKEPAKQKIKRPSISKERDIKKHKQWGDTLPAKVYNTLYNGEVEEIDIGEITPDDFRAAVSDEDARRLIPGRLWDIAPVTMAGFASNFFYEWNLGRPDKPTDLKDIAIRARIEARQNEVMEYDIPSFGDLYDDLRRAQYNALISYRTTVEHERTGADDKVVIQTESGAINPREDAVETARKIAAQLEKQEAHEIDDEEDTDDSTTPENKELVNKRQTISTLEESKIFPPQLPESTEPFENPGKPLGFQIKNLFTFGLQLFKEVIGHKDFQGIATPYENIKVKNLSESVYTKIQKEYDRLAAELTKVATAYDDNFEQVALDFAMDELEVERIVKLYRLTQRLKAGEDVPGISNEAKKHILRKNRYEVQRDKVLDTIQQNRVQLVIIVYDPYRDARNGYVSDLANQLAVTGRKHDAPVDLRLNRFGEEQPEYDAEGNQTGRLEKNYDAMLAGINVPMRNFVDLANSYHAGIAVLPANQALDKSPQTQIRIAQRIHDAILRNNAKNIMIIMPDSFNRNDNPEDAPYKKNVSVILKMALGEMTAGKQFVAPVQAPVKERVLPADLARYAEDKQRYYQEEIDKLMKEKAANPAVQDENNPQAWAWDSLYKHTIEQMQATDRYIADEMIRREREGRPIETVADLERTALVPVQPVPATPGAISPVTKQRRRPDKLTWKEQEIVDEIDRLNAITAETPVAPGETQEPFIEYPPKIKMRLEELEEANRTRAILDSMSPESMREAARKRFGEPGARFAGMRPLSDVMPSAEQQDYSLTHDQIYNTVARMLHGPERANWWQHSQDLDRQVAAIEESADPEGLIQDLVAQATVNNANTPQMIDTLAAQIRSWHDKYVNLERFGEDIEDYSLTAEDFRAGSIASLTFADDLIPITPWLFSGAHGMHDRYLELIRKYKAHVDADMMHFTKWLMEAGLHPDSKFYKKMSRTQRTVATRMLEAVGAILEGSDMVIRARSRSLSQYEAELYAMYNQMQDKALELSREGKKTEASNLAKSAKDLLADGKHNLVVWSEKGFTHEPPIGESAQRMLEEWNKIKLPGQWTAQGFRDAIRQAFDNNRRIANKEVAMLSQGEWIEELKNYITHMYKRGKAMTEQEFEEAKRKFVESSARAEKRRYPTYADAATHGLVPITQNAAQLFKMWGQKVWSLQARKLFLASAINIRDADGSPMLIAIKRPKFEGEGIIDKRTLTEADSLLRKFIDDHNAALPKSRQHEAIKLDANGELDIDVLKELGYVQYASPFNSIEKFWVKDGAALNVMKMLLDKKKEWRPFGGRDWAKGIDTFNSFTKSALLFISAFHPFSLLESFFAAQGLTFRNDLFHLGRFYRNKQDMIKKFQTDEAFVGKWIKHGFGIGHTDPNINQGIVDQTIQSFIDTLKGDTGEEGVLSSMTQYVFDIKKGWDRWLWDEFQPALKLMTAERMLEEERAKAEAAGTKFNEDDAMEQISAVTNKMFGGVEFEKYIWATPKARQLLHALMFAPDWTFAAAEQGLITQLPLFKQMLRSPNLGEIEAAALRKFWIAMGTLVLVGIPNALQAAIYAAAGNPDDGDKPFTFQNEQGKITHIDVTPLVRMMSGVPIVGYEGGDTGKRRVYMRWGKQAYEIGGWFTEPIVTALNKSSMLVHTAWEQATGTTTSGYSEEFRDEGLLGLFSSRGEFLKGRIGSVVSKFMPMNLLSVIQDKPAGWFATASRGKTLGSVIQDMGDLLEVYADQGIAAKLKGIPGHVDKLGVLVDDVVDAGRRNGVDVEEAFKRAQNIVATKYYTIFFKALNKGDTRRMEEAAEAILRLNKGRLNIIRSMKSRLDVSGKGMTAETYSQIAAATEAARANINDQRNRGFKPPRF